MSQECHICRCPNAFFLSGVQIDGQEGDDDDGGAGGEGEKEREEGTVPVTTGRTAHTYTALPRFRTKRAQIAFLSIPVTLGSVTVGSVTNEKTAAKDVNHSTQIQSQEGAEFRFRLRLSKPKPESGFPSLDLFGGFTYSYLNPVLVFVFFKESLLCIEDIIYSHIHSKTFATYLLYAWPPSCKLENGEQSQVQLS